jgi:hypothetical protein
VVVALLEAGPSSPRAVKRQPAGTRALSQDNAWVPATVTSTARGLPLAQREKALQDLISPFDL